ncbi:hypothetical protein SNE40_016622 [Patella caerulea]|uniref:Uncharacterized protein n=1 Tax=Patella caerulea TaxID=87958 RepID=A0AAN8P8G1_PATCE
MGYEVRRETYEVHGSPVYTTSTAGYGNQAYTQEYVVSSNNQPRRGSTGHVIYSGSRHGSLESSKAHHKQYTGTKSAGVGYSSYDPDGVVVVNPQGHHMMVANRPNDYFGLALFSCLCCFCPTGLAALYCSMESRKATDRMDFGKGHKKGKTAKILSLIGIVIGIIIVVIIIILVIIMLVRASNANIVLLG